MFGASLLDEYEHCIVDMGLGWNEVAQLARNSFQHSSLPVRIAGKLPYVNTRAPFWGRSRMHAGGSLTR